MDFDLSGYSEDRLYDHLKDVITRAQKRFGHENDVDYDFKEEDGRVNLLGARGFRNGKPCESTNVKWDDTLFVIYKEDGVKHVEQFAVSTEYGTHGTALLTLGQHKYKLKFHKKSLAHKSIKTGGRYKSGNKYQYRALNPVSPGVRILRDSTRNLSKDAGEKYQNNLTINIHYGGQSDSPKAWSEGCQVIKGWDTYKEFIELVESDHSIIGTEDNELASRPAKNGTRAVIYTLVEGTYLAPTSAFSFPLDLGTGTTVNDRTVKEYYRHTEEEYSGGYYPLGTNTVWHGGLHLHASKGSHVVACSDGVIVGARLADREDIAEGHYGSRNFILVKHQVAGSLLNAAAHDSKPFSDSASEVFYSLYMHLNPEQLKAENDRILSVPWLRASSGAGATSDSDGLRLRIKKAVTTRSAPNTDSSSRVGWFEKGAVVTKVETVGAFYKVRIDASDPKAKWYSGEWPLDEVYVSSGSSYSEPVEGESPSPSSTSIDQKLLDKLASGAVVKLNTRVTCGERLWYSGEYGSFGYRTGLIHWEIFSEKNLFPTADVVEDTDADFNMDSQTILNLVEQEWFGRDDVLTHSEIKNFYSTNPRAKDLRYWACRFRSEWSVDPDVAVPKLKGVWFTGGLKEKISPYLWWNEAAAAGVDLPGTKLVWHYNPIAFLEALTDAQPEES